MQNTRPLFNSFLPHFTIKLRSIKIFKIGFTKLSILPKFWDWHIWQKVRGWSCLRHYNVLRPKIFQSLCTNMLMYWTAYFIILKPLFTFFKHWSMTELKTKAWMTFSSFYVVLTLGFKENINYYKEQKKCKSEISPTLFEYQNRCFYLYNNYLLCHIWLI